MPSEWGYTAEYQMNCSKFAHIPRWRGDAGRMPIV